MDYVIEMNHITKKFGDFKANDDVTLKVKKGEIHALLGENGAGKSTLMSVLFGLYQAEEGEIKINGKKVDILNPNDANALGIGMVHQHFKLVHNFTILENIVLGRETTKFSILQMKGAREKLLKLSEQYKLKIDLDAYISDITVGMQQRVEILKMLYCDNDILIFDEPTAVLTPQEIDELMKIMKQLVDEGKSIIFITHKLNEIKKVANRLTVLRKGKSVGTVDVDKISKEDMSELMVGRKVSFILDKKKLTPGADILKVENLNVDSKHKGKLSVKNASFEVKAGEILCIAGIDGNGQSELAYALTGLAPSASGHIYLKDKDITKNSIRERTLAGMAHIPEDRHKDGLVLDYTLEENLVLQSYYRDRFQKNGFLKFVEIRKYAKELIEKFDIRSSKGETSTARSMSGGNQQKVVVGKWLARDSRVVIFDEPTRGIDIGAKVEIYNLMNELKKNGIAVMFISSEMPELMGIADRIMVMCDGRITGELSVEEATQEEIMRMAADFEKKQSDVKEKVNG